MFQNEKKNKY